MKNVYFLESCLNGEKEGTWDIVKTDSLSYAEFVVVNDLTTIKDELKRANVSSKTFDIIINTINKKGIYNLAGDDIVSINDIETKYYKEMKKYLCETDETTNTTEIVQETPKEFTCVNCVCYPVCKYVDKVEQALTELSKIGIKLTSCDYFVKC